MVPLVSVPEVEVTLLVFLLYQASTREIEGLGDFLAWVKDAVPARFRGTGLPEIRRMRVRTFTYSSHSHAYVHF